MGERSQRAPGKGMKVLLVPAVIALMAVIAFAAQAAFADHGGPHVKLVTDGDPPRNLSVAPLVLLSIGDRASIDLLVEFPSTSDDMYAAEFHMRIDGAKGILKSVDAAPGFPGLQLALSGDRLALTGKEALRTSIVGSPDNGGFPRSCTLGMTTDGLFFAKVDGGQVPTDSPAMGKGRFWLNQGQTELAFEIKIDRAALKGPLSVAHIHNAPAGSNGGPVRTLVFTADTAMGVWRSSDSEPFTAGRLAELLAGGLYVNVHTSAHTGGEIRGQIYPAGAGDDSRYTFVKGATGDTTNIQLQTLGQRQRAEWGNNWCGPTAAGSLTHRFSRPW